MKRDVLHIYADAAVGAHRAGLGLAFKDERGWLVGWRMRPAQRMTNNEAEYHAVIFALEQALRLSPQEVHIFCDNRVIVEQLCGLCEAHAESMQRLLQRAQELARRLALVTFTYVPREENRLADALANEALLGPRRPVPNRSATTPHRSGFHGG
ncbi:MAG: ribonuclease HI family protein [Anaerolineae bacterium]|nr:ribonuclease HI family protein [Candidatus Roseilinea sp.]MDW8449260.1 ribonuclease HI family protein [Anaerolineae bacterium]